MLRLQFFNPTSGSDSKCLEGSFDYNSPAHLEFINKKIDNFKNIQQKLISVDNKLLIGLFVGSAGWIGSYIFPTVSLSIMGFSYATYNATIRDNYFNKYKEAFHDLVLTYQWCMGKETNDHWYKFAVKQIQNLILTLGPWVSKNTLVTWNEDVFKPAKIESFTKNSQRRTDIPIEFETALNKILDGSHTNQWKFQLYGENCTDLMSFIQFYGTEKTKEIVSSFALKR